PAVHGVAGSGLRERQRARPDYGRLQQRRLGAHGQPGVYWKPQGERSVGVAYGIDEADRVCGPALRVPGPDRQPDERGDAAALAVRMQPQPARVAEPGDW